MKKGRLFIVTFALSLLLMYLGKEPVNSSQKYPVDDEVLLMEQVDFATQRLFVVIDD